jgi:LytS/YehU family sensor histidine kinase
LRRYLAIEETRFEDRLAVSIEVEADAEERTVPGFLLHPLVENAIKHGMGTSPRPLQVNITARVEGADLRIEVANTGKLVQEGRESGVPDTDVVGARGSSRVGASPLGARIGLRNVAERLERLYPGVHRFEVRQDGEWVRVVIEIQQPRSRS